MNSKYIRLWFRTEGNWFHEEYLTNDAQWREAFLLLKASGANVRLEYVDTNNVLHIEKSISGYIRNNVNTKQTDGEQSSTLSV